MASTCSACQSGDMKLSTPYKCDYCERLKGETNHWWLAVHNSAPRWARNPDKGLLLLPWDEEGAKLPGVKHICSEQCASKALSRFMAAITGGVIPK